MEGYKTSKRNFYKNISMAVSQNFAELYCFLFAKLAKANWIWLRSFLRLAKMAIYSVSLLDLGVRCLGTSPSLPFAPALTRL